MSDPHAIAAAWSALRGVMIRERPPAFTRDEWAYLIQFLETGTLGEFIGGGRGRERVTLVLPNNVSLLGPLVLVVATLGARTVHVKLGSRGDDVVAPFLDFARAHATPVLAERLAGVDSARLDRGDPRLAAWLAEADVRVAFGSDAAVAAVAALPHRAGSRFLGFGDMYSEAWIDAGADLDTLIKVFAIYGQAGCTSPRRTVVLDATAGDVAVLRQRLVARWPEVIRGQVAMHQASQNLLFDQLARHAGADSVLTPGHAAVLAIAPRRLAVPPGPLTLVLSPATVDEAVAALPANLQTVGLALAPAALARARAALAATPARRVVALGRMHHFEPRWDGQSLPQAFFEAAP